jgi:hypothetical protein
MNAHLRIRRSLDQSLDLLGWLLLIAPLALSIPARAAGPEINIESTGDGNAVLSWPQTTEDCVLLTSSTLDGPWDFCWAPVIRGGGRCQAVVSTSGECSYFKLVQGYWDDFEDGDLDGWILIPEDPLLLDHVTVEATNGQLHIQGSPPAGISRRLLLACTNLLLTGCSAQIDVLGWDDTAGNQPVIGLLGRVDPRIVESPPVVYFYLGGATVASTEYPGQSSLWIWKKGADYDGLASAIATFGPRMQPSANHRIVLEVFDNAQQPTGFVRLLDESGNLIAENTATDNGIPLTQGLVGIYVHEQSQSGTMDFWLDDFRVVGTKP